jgi:magnesium-transporting ATPase (P-type)
LCLLKYGLELQTSNGMYPKFLPGRLVLRREWPDEQVLKDIVGQSLFQLAVMYLLVFHGDAIFHVEPGYAVQGASQHYTIVFNSFVMLQLFNQINARKIHDEANILDGILDNQLFLYILGGEALLQVPPCSLFALLSGRQNCDCHFSLLLLMLSSSLPQVISTLQEIRQFWCRR